MQACRRSTSQLASQLGPASSCWLQLASYVLYVARSVGRQVAKKLVRLSRDVLAGWARRYCSQMSRYGFPVVNCCFLTNQEAAGNFFQDQDDLSNLVCNSHLATKENTKQNTPNIVRILSVVTFTACDSKLKVIATAVYFKLSVVTFRSLYQ